MIDSWSPRKLEPGFAHIYSIPSDLMTSTMKSDPVRLAVSTSALDGVPTSAVRDIAGGVPGGRTGVGSLPGASDAAARTAAPTAAFLRKSRRFTNVFLGFAIVCTLISSANRQSLTASALSSSFWFFSVLFLIFFCFLAHCHIHSEEWSYLFR